MYNSNYEAQALVYTLQGLVNRATPRLLLDLGASNVDFPLSDTTWKKYFEQQRGIAFEDVHHDLCALVAHFFRKGDLGRVMYDSDGYSLFLAMTFGGLNNVVPVSNSLAHRFSCLDSLPIRNALPSFDTKAAAHACYFCESCD